MVNELTITPSSVVVWCQEPLSAEIDGEIVLMRITDGLYFGLDTVGSDVWRKLAHPVKIADICTSLAERYEAAPGVIEQDVLELISKLYERQLVEVLK